MSLLLSSSPPLPPSPLSSFVFHSIYLCAHPRRQHAPVPCTHIHFNGGSIKIWLFAFTEDGVRNYYYRITINGKSYHEPEFEFSLWTTLLPLLSVTRTNRDQMGSSHILDFARSLAMLQKHRLLWVTVTRMHWIAPYSRNFNRRMHGIFLCVSHSTSSLHKSTTRLCLCVHAQFIGDDS